MNVIELSLINYSLASLCESKLNNPVSRLNDSESGIFPLVSALSSRGSSLYKTSIPLPDERTL